MTTIAQEWKHFEDRVIPLDAPDIQRVEMKKAFYGGASIILHAVSAISSETADADVAALKIERLFRETRQFAASLKFRWQDCCHDWRVKIDSQSHSDLETDVVCERCGCSGSKNNKSGEVFFPAT